MTLRKTVKFTVTLHKTGNDPREAPDQAPEQPLTSLWDSAAAGKCVAGKHC